MDGRSQFISDSSEVVLSFPSSAMLHSIIRDYMIQQGYSLTKIIVIIIIIYSSYMPALIIPSTIAVNVPFDAVRVKQYFSFLVGKDSRPITTVFECTAVTICLLGSERL